MCREWGMLGFHDQQLLGVFYIITQLLESLYHAIFEYQIPAGI